MYQYYILLVTRKILKINVTEDSDRNITHLSVTKEDRLSTIYDIKSFSVVIICLRVTRFQ